MSNFWKAKTLLTPPPYLCKVNFCIRNYFIQCNTHSYCLHITIGVNIHLYVCIILNIYLYMCVSLFVLVCLLCVYLCMCDFKLDYQKKQCHPCQTCSTSYALLHKTHNKVRLVIRFQGLKSLVPKYYSGK